ncbi:Uncharacterised protein [Vibrio cholerae]|nr:Uncharacterised protein [Vibrio cholerae]CSI30935.1 Uncharacterised protein [Vibrio cholerae]CSI47213.1 Uncharacterised protein [Vibrio cholerae]
MANTRLVVNVVGAPQGSHFAEQIGLLVAVLSTAEEVNRIWA